MDEFENQNNNQQRPDYYQPNNNGTYYTPPQSEKPPVENTTYHYSYAKPDERNQSNESNYYTPPQNEYYSSANYNQDNNGNKPPKKSKAAIILVIVLVACLVIAGVALIASTTSDLIDNSDTKTNQTQEDTDTKLNDSEEVPLKGSDNNYTVAGVAKKCKDSCVGITVYSEKASAYNYFFGYGQQNDSSSSEPTLSGEGSGVIMTESNGKTYIITCAHVIEGGDSFKITLDNKKEYDAVLVGTDAQTDIGVLSINETGLSVAEFADSDNLVVGEQVVAIGCPGGLEFMNSTTSGYVSALDRPISSGIGYDNKCIQIDAAINPGNSGGALFNMQGQVIGINSSKIASMEYEGMGFAVPSKTAIDTANSLIRVGYVEGRAKIGITYNQLTNFNNSNTIVEALAEKGYKNAKGTMVISEVDSSSDLANKDIKQYDMIIAVNDEVLTSTDIMTSVLADSKPGDTIKLTIARIENNDIKIREIECKLIESKG